MRENPWWSYSITIVEGAAGDALVDVMKYRHTLERGDHNQFLDRCDCALVEITEVNVSLDRQDWADGTAFQDILVAVIESGAE